MAAQLDPHGGGKSAVVESAEAIYFHLYSNSLSAALQTVAGSFFKSPVNKALREPRARISPLISSGLRATLNHDVCRRFIMFVAD